MGNSIFSQIIGHEKVCEYFEQIIENQQISHAFLFVGPANVGKTALAEALIKEMMGTNQLESHPDFIAIKREIDEKTDKQKAHISVKQIRDLRDRLAMTAMQGGRKAVFIEEADKMNLPAANALLKTLEEPKGETIIILRAAQIEGVPATIASRCQILRFHQVSAEKIDLALRERGVSHPEAKTFAALAAGRPGLALRLIKDSEYKAEHEVAISTLINLLGQSTAERFKTLSEILPKEEINKAQMLDKQLDSWENVIYDFWRQALGLAKKIDWPINSETMAQKSASDWQKVLRTIQEARRAAAHNANPQLVLEHILLAI
ncbi:AAA family ATPase [Patescibacteria group bacterium]|nr:AAA family ATPase [Patescibacteria group bacterium]MBU1705763.1 AAA family ATPase [Patescibacteria group bacterium]